MLRIKKLETRRITNNLFRETSCYSKNRLQNKELNDVTLKWE